MATLYGCGVPRPLWCVAHSCGRIVETWRAASIFFLKNLWSKCVLINNDNLTYFNDE